MTIARQMPTERQQAALTLLSLQSERRHLYLSQSGGYYVTYSAGERYEPLDRADVDQLLAGGWITECWRDFFKLAPKFATQRRSRPLTSDDFPPHLD